MDSNEYFMLEFDIILSFTLKLNKVKDQKSDLGTEAKWLKTHIKCFQFYRKHHN